MLKDAGVWDDNYLDILITIEENCQLCKSYTKTPPRPVVGLPMAHEFNEKVAMDLKKWKGRWILHMIDMWSRYTASVFIDRKRPSDIIEAMMTHWIGKFGIMKSVLTDNGGEFNSDELREVQSILNIQVCTTAGESPFQNGLCERVHAVTDMMLTKLEDEQNGATSETLLCWANMARNCLQMWNGFSSHQLVFGTNPNLPGIMTDKLPALDGTTTSETFAKHLNTLHASRKAFIDTEANERIRRALRTKVRAAEQMYMNGDIVFYKREGKEKWLGPGKVVFQDGKVVFVRHGSVFVRVSPNRLCKVNPVESNEDGYTQEIVNTGKDDAQIVQKDTSCNRENSKVSTGTETTDPQIISEEIPTLDEARQATETQRTERSKLKVNDRIQYRVRNDDEWVNARVIGRAGKVTGKYKDWYNVQDDGSNEQKSIDVSQYIWKKVTNIDDSNMNNVHAVTCKVKDNEIELAKETELKKLCQFNTYEEVANNGQSTLTTRWVITNKDGKTKARLVVRGFEEDFIMPKDSPTVGKGAMRMILAVASSMKWIIKTTDIKSAFLQGKELDRDVYLRPPAESHTPNNMIWKLKHGLYGLKDGARQFFVSVKEELLKLGFKQCLLDPAIFFLHKDGKLDGIICCHVDDFLHSGGRYFETLIRKLRKRFYAGKVEEKCFKYIGFKVKQKENVIILDQSDYMNNINHPVLDPRRTANKADILNNEEQSLYRQIVGQINWAVQGSRPDLAFEMIAASTKLKQASVADLTKAIKLLNRLKDVESYMVFPSLSQENNDREIVIFTDASLGNINDGTGSTGAYIVWLADRSGLCCPLAWHASKIKRVVRSTIAAEALSLQEGLEAGFYYRTMVEEILGVPNKSISITAYTDNKSVIEAVFSTKLVDDKRLRVDIAAIQEFIQTNDINKIKWCAGDNQLANCMTKQGASGYQLLNVLQYGKMPNEFLNV